MGFVSLPEGVSPQQYNDWLQTSAGQSYMRPIQSQVNRGLSVSHAPPASAFRQSSQETRTPATSAPRYGQWIGMPSGRMRTADFRDTDGDMVEDRYQAGPGAPRQSSGGGSSSGARSQSLDMSTYTPPRPSRTTASQPPSNRQPMGDAMLPPGWSYGPNGERLRPGQTISPRSPLVNSTPSQPNLGGMDNQFQPGFFSTSRNFDGSLTSQPNYAFRDAFVNSINDAMFPYYANSGTYLGEGAPPSSWGQAPSLDFNQLMAQSRDMVADGWTNPFLSQMTQSPLAGLFG